MAWAPRCYDFRTAPDAADLARRLPSLRGVDGRSLLEPLYFFIGIELNLPPLRFRLGGDGGRGECRLRRGQVATPVDCRVPLDPDRRAVRPRTRKLSGRCRCRYLLRPGLCQPRAREAPICFRRLHLPPYLGAIPALDTLPTDWFTRAAAPRGGERAVIAEVGWLSDPPLPRPRPGSASPPSPPTSRSRPAYLDRVLAAADTGPDGPGDLDSPFGISSWHPSWANAAASSPRSGAPFETSSAVLRPPGTVDSQLAGELLLKAFGTMGLRTYAGTAQAGRLPPMAASQGLAAQGRLTGESSPGSTPPEGDVENCEAAPTLG